MSGTSKMVKCDECGKMFRARGLRRHQMIVHENKPSPATFKKHGTKKAPSKVPPQESEPNPKPPADPPSEKVGFWDKPLF